MREWTAIGFSSIYYLLNKLEKAGLVEKSAAEADRGPSRNVFNLTPAGFQSLRQGAMASLARNRGDYQTLMMGLANLPILSRQEALSALIEHQEGLAGRRQHISQRLEDQQPVPGIVHVLFDISFTMIDARLSWLNSFIEEIESGQFTWPGQYSQEENSGDPRKA